MNYYSIGEFAKLIGKTEQTLRNWDKSGKLTPHHVSECGYRKYSEEQFNSLMKFKNLDPPDKKIVGYCRVVCDAQQKALDEQIDLLSQYMTKNGYQFEIMSDIGVSAYRENFVKLLNEVMESKVERIVVMCQATLAVCGYEMLELVCKKFNTAIEVVNKTPTPDEAYYINEFRKIVEGKTDHFTKKDNPY